MVNAHEEAKELRKETSEYINKYPFSEKEIDNLHRGKRLFREVEVGYVGNAWGAVMQQYANDNEG